MPVRLVKNALRRSFPQEVQINPWARLRELEAALAHQRLLTEQERRRAEALEQASRTAWRIAAGGRPAR